MWRKRKTDAELIAELRRQYKANCKYGKYYWALPIVLLLILVFLGDDLLRMMFHLFQQNPQNVMELTVVFILGLVLGKAAGVLFGLVQNVVDFWDRQRQHQLTLELWDERKTLKQKFQQLKDQITASRNLSL